MESVAHFRKDPEAAKVIVEKLAPDAEQRGLLLGRLADSIQAAHELNPEGWELSLRQSGAYIRLNVGGIAALSLHRDTALLALDLESGPIAGGAPGEEEKRFKVLDTVTLYKVEHAELLRRWEGFQTAHLAAIERASKQMKRSPWWPDHAPGLVQYIGDVVGRELAQPGYVDELGGPEAEFPELFAEFVESYLNQPGGEEHFATYEAMRAQGRANFEQVLEAAGRGDDITDLVLTKLLPYHDTPAVRDLGGWTNIAPVFRGDPRARIGGADWAEGTDWSQVARAILDFVRRCGDDPEQLEQACREFGGSDLSKGFQSGTLSPILNALRPDDYLLINSKPLQVIRWLTGKNLSARISDYPRANAICRETVERWTDSMRSIAETEGRPEDLFDQFCHWLVAIKGLESKQPVGYWKIAPGENAKYWDECLEGGFIAIGWSELGDLEGVSLKEFRERRDPLVERYPDWTKAKTDQVWKFARIRVGDRIVANRGTREVVGFGTVTEPYHFVEGEDYGHRLGVRWDRTDAIEVSEPGWKKTLVKLDPQRFEKLLTGASTRKPSARALFTKTTFELLSGLSGSPTKAFYDARKEDFKENVEGPLQALLNDVIDRLPETITAVMETKKGLFSRILKNDWGRGGAWDYYWGALYPKGGRRITDAQLFIFLHRFGIDFGFYLGERGDEARNLFLRNRDANQRFLAEHMRPGLSNEDLVFGTRDNEARPPEKEASPRWQDWLVEREAREIRAGVPLTSAQCLAIPGDELAGRIAKTFEDLFPLALLAASDDPLPEIEKYLGLEGPEFETQPAYSLEQCVEDTGFRLDQLASWIRAVDRKGQAILYGPPGTGKTFIAERLADHLIGGGIGFRDLVQFHPSYAYEDFIQGIRPGTTAGGDLTFETVKGRFWAFCAKARRRLQVEPDNAVCVLIIDEINRANLSRVFGELMYLLEYRKRQIPVAGGDRLQIPKNVRILGTMNTADRSIALVDHALRRRFAFLTLQPDYGVLRHYHRKRQTGFDPEGLITVLQRLNIKIGEPNYEVGISFFLLKDVEQQLPDIWSMEIVPYLEEYFFDQRGTVDEFRWEQVGKEILPAS